MSFLLDLLFFIILFLFNFLVSLFTFIYPSNAIKQDIVIIILNILIRLGVLFIRKANILFDLNFDKLIKQKLNITHTSKIMVFILPIFKMVIFDKSYI